MYSWAQRVWTSLKKHEREALLSVGKKKWGVMDDIMNGKRPRLDSPAYAPKRLSQEESELLKAWSTELKGNAPRPSDLAKFVQEKKIFGLEIPRQHGGLGLSPSFHSKLLKTVASVDRDGNWLHRIMVPNSLGLGQLLVEYGTPAQKEDLLPRLCSGEFISAFGLTGPWNGSDAAGSMPVEGCVETRNGKKGILFSTEKRWITLSPVAHYLGLAIRHKEPSGISLIMVDVQKYSESIEIKSHCPIGSKFPNGHIIIKDLWIPLEDALIGGETNLGKGWVMLMSCLQKGRGISLPSVSDGVNGVVLWKTFFYANIRKQFSKRLIDMDAIQAKIADMTIQTYMGRLLNEFYLSSHGQSSALSAIMKFVLTEYSRNIIQQSMDIFAGKGITLGDKNPIAHFYLQTPIGITVEGSNTLTENVIIPIQSIFEHQASFRNVLETLEKRERFQFYQTVLSKVPDIGSHMLTACFHFNPLQRQCSTLLLESYACLLRGQAMETQQEVARLFSRHVTGTVLLCALEWASQASNPVVPKDDCLHEETKKWVHSRYFGKQPVSLWSESVFNPFFKNKVATHHISHLLLHNSQFRDWIEQDMILFPDDPLVIASKQVLANNSVQKDLQRQVIDVDSF